MTDGGDKPKGDEPPVDFTTLVLSLSTSAFVQLGVTPGASPGEQNIPMAKHTIDLLAMLEEKTRGNLTGEEERLLSEVLYDLRMRYLEAKG